MAKITRTKIYVPIFEGAIKGYVINQINLNFWRVEATMEKKDLLQEAYLVYLRLATKYGVLDTPQHFMALFKIAWRNHFNDLSTSDSKHRVLSIESITDESEELLAGMIGELENLGHLATMIRQAPEDLRRLFSILLEAPDSILQVLSNLNGRNHRKANQKLCSMLGLSPETDLRGSLQKFLLH